MADLRVREFPDDLHDEANLEASRDGDHLRELVIEAIKREVARRQAIPTDVRNQRKTEKRERKRQERAEQRAEAAE